MQALAGLSLVSNNPKSNLSELKHRTPKGQPVGGGTQHPLLASVRTQTDTKDSEALRPFSHVFYPAELKHG